MGKRLGANAYKKERYKFHYEKLRMKQDTRAKAIAKEKLENPQPKPEYGRERRRRSI